MHRAPSPPPPPLPISYHTIPPQRHRHHRHPHRHHRRPPHHHQKQRQQHCPLHTIASPSTNNPAQHPTRTHNHRPTPPTTRSNSNDHTNQHRLHNQLVGLYNFPHAPMADRKQMQPWQSWGPKPPAVPPSHAVGSEVRVKRGPCTTATMAIS